MRETLNHQPNDHQGHHMVPMSQLYPHHDEFVPSQGEISKPKRRRKKNKSSENGNTLKSKKRKLSDEQVHMLEVSFGNEHKLESERKNRIASELGLDPRQVAVWFQNRRARWKNKKLEDEFSEFKKLHQIDLLEKSRLQSEVMKLKEQLIEAEKEIQRLTERVENGGLSNSPSSTLSMETIIMDHPPFLGEFGMEGYDDHIFFMPETNYINGMVEWINLYM